MNRYGLGQGHVELAAQLGIKNSFNLAIPGSCNSRIIRTTLKDSYQTTEKTLYIIGLTFLARGELPINAEQDLFEGRWLSTQHFHLLNKNKSDLHWTESDSKKYMELKTKSEMFTEEDRLENLMYLLVSMIGDLLRRGHQIVVFRQPDDLHECELDNIKFTLLKKCVNIIDGLKWAAIPWQVSQNIQFAPEDANLPMGIRHPLSGEHGSLNNFLLHHIKQHDLHLSVL
jgi:hypothetical protein